MPWVYYDILAGKTDADTNALPEPPNINVIKTVDSFFQGQGGVPLLAGGLVTQNNVKDALAKWAYALYGMPLTKEKILAVPLMWKQGTDSWDSARPILSAGAGILGGALAPFTFGASAGAGALLAHEIAANGQQIVTTTDPKTGQQSTYPVGYTTQPQNAGLSPVASSVGGDNSTMWLLGIGFLVVLILIISLLRK